MMAEGGGIEPLRFHVPWFSGPVAGHSAAPSVVLAEGGRIERPCACAHPRLSKPEPYRSVIPPGLLDDDDIGGFDPLAWCGVYTP